MNFTNLNLTLPSEEKTITINDQQIKILPYLPISDKNDLISIALQKAEVETGVYNDILLDMYFHLNIIYLYTNIEFSDEDRADEFALYDILEANEVIDKVIAAIGEEEYQLLEDYLQEVKWSNIKFKTSAAGVLKIFTEDLPKNAAAAQAIVDNFDKDKYQSVKDFATAANGGRNIITNIAETVN